MNTKLTKQTGKTAVQTENDLEKLLSHQTSRLEQDVPCHTLGTVLEIHTDSVSVKTDQGIISSRRAASCLLMPQPGDTVLVSGPSVQKAYIIAVIEQVSGAEQKIDLPGTLAISAEDLRLTSRASMHFESEDMTLKSKAATCVVEETQFVGRELNATVGIVRLVGKVCETVVDRLSHMCKRAFRFTEETEQVRMGTMDYQAENSARVHAKYTMVTAKDLVKVDSDQIHMG